MKYEKNEYSIYDERDKVQLDKVESLLRGSYWASERSIEDIKISIENSVCFSLFNAEQQIGFARVVTDFASVAYIADVIINPDFRQKGLGKWLTQVVVNDKRWKTKLQLLVTDDAHTLYQRLGLSNSDKLLSSQV
ncbi:GNAT family N-acetyltransferase [Psychromonas sp. Urea-02u-13]|uniref:GNAT family N-acetyltransferase n=1 Tax=Psychromonas sp. Urea-02u-13 TaxID=2058326 RepID=UPI000C3424D5|nr:GNAT family N-acetyltransferase [Psychromonas sp. Urea-02u-13]PKG38281.1 GNAT family N-acetyltransferase [Psychromonas sp. Urea-02u-13]